MTAKRQKTRRRLKSSLKVRRLLRAAVKRHKTYRAVARLFGVSSHTYVIRMLKGTMRDTPEMKLAVARADERAKRAWEGRPYKTDAAMREIDHAIALEVSQAMIDMGEYLFKLFGGKRNGSK